MTYSAYRLLGIYDIVGWNHDIVDGNHDIVDGNHEKPVQNHDVCAGFYVVFRLCVRLMGDCVLIMVLWGGWGHCECGDDEGIVRRGWDVYLKCDYLYNLT